MKTKENVRHNKAVYNAMDIQMLRRDFGEAMESFEAARRDVTRAVDRITFAAREVCGALEGIEVLKSTPPDVPSTRRAA